MAMLRMYKLAFGDCRDCAYKLVICAATQTGPSRQRSQISAEVGVVAAKAAGVYCASNSTKAYRYQRDDRNLVSNRAANNGV